ncbi:MAG: non-homologous end-joining DNA ligase [Armatimonadetes bacterium]|nr:non-homologous end-joining DNA ligase [Armatimonadota bacterium]
MQEQLHSPVEKNEVQSLDGVDLKGDLRLKVDGNSVSLTNLDKIYWPQEGISKGELLKYYWDISDVLLPHLRERPLILKRHPDGISGPWFFQHNVESAPSYVQTFERQDGEKTIHHVLVNNKATLLYVVNLGTIAQNCWSSTVAHPDKPDWIVFDLDPGEVKYAQVLRVALELRETLAQIGLKSWCKTSGSRGAHVYVPINAEYSYDATLQFGEAVCQKLARQLPEFVTLERSIRQRPPDRIYLDYMQNSEGKSVASAYSVRARAHASVSTPLTWEEVSEGLSGNLKPTDFTIRTMPQRLKKVGDLFEEVISLRQSLPDLSTV